MQEIQRDLNLVNQMWERSLTVSLIAEDLEHCSQDDHADSVLRRMEENNWDEIGLCSNPTMKATASSYVHRRDLAGLSGDLSDFQGRPFDISDLVSGDSSIAQCLQQLIERERLFVLESSGIRKIVTIADLTKQPVRVMLFAAVSLLEMAMLSKINDLFQQSEWENMLSKARVEKAEYLFAERKRKGQDVVLADCLQLCDKATILLKRKEIYREWGFQSKNEATSFFNKVNDLRDKLAHAHDPAGDSDWSEVGKMYSTAESLIWKMTTVSDD